MRATIAAVDMVAVSVSVIDMLTTDVQARDKLVAETFLFNRCLIIFSFSIRNIRAAAANLPDYLHIPIFIFLLIKIVI